MAKKAGMSVSFPYLLQCNKLENMTCDVLSCLQGNILSAESQDTLLWMCRITQRTLVHEWCNFIPTKQWLHINSMKIVTKGKMSLSHCDFSACSYSICGRQGDEVWHSHLNECQTL